MDTPRPGTITVAWVTVSLLPLIVVVLAAFALESWSLRVLLIVGYLLCAIPYGFFVAMPIMVWLFRKPASTHRRQ
jgi:hypothetical protein